MSQEIIKGIELYKGNDIDAFRLALVKCSINLNIPAEWILFVFYYESKLNPTAVNKLSGAFGLFQVMPSTAPLLGISFDNYKKLSGSEQVIYFEKYVKPYRKYIKSPFDLYLCVFYPKALKSFNDKTEFPNSVKKQNSVFVKNGSLTKLTIKNAISKYYYLFGLSDSTGNILPIILLLITLKILL